MGYNQRQIAMLGVAKDIGDAIGFIAGSLCEVVPIWVVLFIGVAQNFFGYGLVWLTVNGTLPHLPLWVLLEDGEEGKDRSTLKSKLELPVQLCIAVPCHILKFWAFIGIMFQVPLVLVTSYLQNKFQNSMVGNIISVGEDFLVNFYEGPPFKFKRSHRDHTNFVNCVRFSPNGTKFIIVGI